MDRRELGEVLNVSDLSMQLKRVDSKMKKIIGPISLGKGARQLIEAGGKRLRPALVIACARLGAPQTDERTITAAATVELLHLASLVHDDVIDNARSRRGIKAVNISHGDSHSILLGDFLIAKALGSATALDQRIGELLAKTLSEMVIGVSAEPTHPSRQFDKSYFDSVRKKTAKLMAAACQTGGLCGNLPPKRLETLEEYGTLFGISFQIIDDILDGDIKKSSKAKALSLIRRNNQKAALLAKALRTTETGVSLAELPGFYLDWALKIPA